MHVVYYEKLTRHIRQELEALANFLGKTYGNVKVFSIVSSILDYCTHAEFPVDSRRMDCIEESPEGSFHRHHDAEKRPVFPYTLEQVELYTKEICLVDSILQRHHHSPLPIDLYREDLRNNFRINEDVLNKIRCRTA